MINPKRKLIGILLIIIGAIITSVATTMIANSYEYQTFGTVEGTGVLLSSAAFLISLAGFVTYARAKNRSGLLGAVLSLFSLLGFIILLLLRDLPAPTTTRA